MPNRRTAIAAGVGRAAAAAALFGASTPLVEHASRGAGTFTSAGLLYLGAGAASALALRLQPGVAVHPKQTLWKVLLGVALLGAVVAPAALVMGLRATPPATASLLLVLEAPFTLMLARLFYREHVGVRVVVASMALLAGVVTLLGGPQDGLGGFLPGAAWVVVAALGWALDNTLSRHLADVDPGMAVAGKGLVGGTLACLLGAALGQAWPDLVSTAVLLGTGAAGYGLSLQLYLGAQRVMGASRTASVFSAAPLMGAGVSLLWAGTLPGPGYVAAAALILLGLWLHATERHSHPHTHPPQEHDHPHDHGDGHHAHVHVPEVVGVHSHVHRHEVVNHAHEHGEDHHHRHAH